MGTDTLERHVWLAYHKQHHNKCNSWWLLDAKGIPLSRVCDECIAAVKDQYPPEVLGISGTYTDIVDEQIEEI